MPLRSVFLLMPPSCNYCRHRITSVDKPLMLNSGPAPQVALQCFYFDGSLQAEGWVFDQQQDGKENIQVKTCAASCLTWEHVLGKYVQFWARVVRGRGKCDVWTLWQHIYKNSGNHFLLKPTQNNKNFMAVIQVFLRCQVQMYNSYECIYPPHPTSSFFSSLEINTHSNNNDWFLTFISQEWKEKIREQNKVFPPSPIGMDQCRRLISGNH